MTVYDRIKALREELGMTQTELAKRAGYRERSTIARIEAGDVDLSQSRLASLAEALGTTPQHLLGWDEPEADGLTEDERRILAFYRAAPENVRALIDKIAEG